VSPPGERMKTLAGSRTRQRRTFNYRVTHLREPLPNPGIIHRIDLTGTGKDRSPVLDDDPRHILPVVGIAELHDLKAPGLVEQPDVAVLRGDA
jgi:hypothetical protein